MNIKSLISTVAIVAGMSTVAPAAQAFEFDDIDWSVSADIVSEYVFRGGTLGSESTQLGLEAGYNNFYVGLWTNNGFAEESNENADELDIYAGYGFDIANGFSADIGGTIYHYPQSGDLTDFGADDASTFELYGGIAYDHQFSPSVYVYYDTELENLTVEGSAGYTYALSPSFDLNLGGTIGFVTLDEDSETLNGDIFDDYTYGSISADVTYPFSDATSAYFGINGGFSSEDTFVDANDAFNDFEDNGVLTEDHTDSTTFWVGTGISHSF